MKKLFAAIRGHRVEVDPNWVRPMPTLEEFATRYPGSTIVRYGPIPEDLQRAIENKLIGIHDRETLTEDDKFALAYKAGASVSVDDNGKAKIEPPCSFLRVDGKWHVAFSTAMRWKHSSATPDCNCEFPRILEAFPHECQNCMRLLPPRNPSHPR